MRSVPEEALPALERAIRSAPPQALTLYYLGRCQRALDRPEEAVRTLQRALELALAQAAGDRLLRLIHNQLATALRALGREDEAVPHFVEAKRLWALESDAEKRQLDSYLAGQPDPDTGPASVAALVEESPLSGLTPAQRVELGRRVRAELARAELNLGVMQAQAERFVRAVEHLREGGGDRSRVSRGCSTRWGWRASTRGSSTRPPVPCLARSRRARPNPGCGTCWRRA